MADAVLIAVLASLDVGLRAAADILLGRPRPARQLLGHSNSSRRQVDGSSTATAAPAMTLDR
jgi:hypothetical protein